MAERKQAKHLYRNRLLLTRADHEAVLPKGGMIFLLGGGRGCHGKAMADYAQEQDELQWERRLHRMSKAKEVSRSKSVIIIDSNREQSREVLDGAGEKGRTLWRWNDF